MRTPSDGSREIGEEGIEESLLDEIVGKLINEGKLEKAASICTFVSPHLFRIRLTHAPNATGKQFNLEGRDLMIVRAMNAIADGSASVSSLPASTPRSRAPAGLCVANADRTRGVHQKSWIC
jgi:hypothetical protein